MLRGFPMPKLAIHQKTDIKSRKSVKYVVDGQQRTNTIVDFFKGTLRLSRTLELERARGKLLDQLDEDLQLAFLSYPLQFDQFEAVGEDVVREYFRRINSFTAPLNPEEKRNADFQGNMKWLILKLTDRHSETLLSLGALIEREVIRMGDDKLLAECVHAMLNGVKTTTSGMLNSMYKVYERKPIPEENTIEKAIDEAFDRILGWPELRLTSLLGKTHVFYSLLLAVIAVQSEWPTLQAAIGGAAGKRIRGTAEANLLALADALDGSGAGQFPDFVAASNEKTNTREQREARISWIAAAMTQADFA